MMECDRTPDAAELYVSGTMPEPDRAAFEDHFFGCNACFGQVQALQDTQLALRAEVHQTAGAHVHTTAHGGRLPLTWMAVAATIVLAVALWQFPAKPQAPTAVAPSATVQPAEQPPPPSPTAPTAQAATAPPAPVPAPTRNATTVRTPPPSLEQLAAVRAPKYVPLVTRSQDNPDMTAFAAAMTHYSAGRYADAARGLRAIVEHAPEMAQAQFFLGVSELMTGHPREAHAALDQTVASGVSPYSDEAHFYLAKADLREKNVTAARKELMLAVDLEAGPGGEAARLLEALNQFER